MEDDSCDPLIRIGFIHEFSSFITKLIGFEKINVFMKRFKRITITLGLLFALSTLKGHFSGFFTGESFHNCFVGYGSCNIIFYGQHRQIVWSTVGMF